MIRVRFPPRRARRLLLLAAALSAAAPALAQTPDDLRPALEEETEPVAPPPVAAPPTTLEIDPPDGEIIQPRRRRAAPADPYAPLGLRLGGLTAFPSLGIGVVVTDNVRRTKDNRKADVGLRLRPALRVESDWVRHSLRLGGSGEFIFYEEESGFGDTEADLEARLRLDVRHTTQLELEGGYRLTQESAADREVPDSAVGNRQDENFQAAASLSHDIGRLEARLRGGASLQVYDDVELAGGGREDNSDRDYVQPEIGVRLTYETSPAFKPFIEAAYRPRLHTKTVDRNGLRRDSDGYAAAAGAAFDISEIWSGEAALTYLIRDYEDPALDTIQAIGLAGNITWRPTELTALTLTTATSIDESSSATQGGTRNYDVALDIRHALRENLELNGGVGLGYDDAKGGGDDLTTTSHLGVVWQANPWFAWTAGYDVTWFNASGGDSDYREHRAGVGIEIRR